MHPFRSYARLIFTALLCILLAAAAQDDKLSITSTPSGATRQIDGVLVGTTPYEKSIPGGYLHKTKTTIGSRLEHPMIARPSLGAYAAKEILITDDPMK